MKALSGPLQAVDIKTAQFPIKEREAFYASSGWLRLIGKIIKERGRVCQDPQHEHNRSHRLKNALPDPAKLGRIYGDHIIELRDGGEPLSASNIILRCAVCHGRKTATTRNDRQSIKYQIQS